RESKKRVVEYLLNMDTLKNEKLRHRLKIKESSIVEKWKRIFHETAERLGNMGLVLKGISENVEILDEPDHLIKVIYQDGERFLTIDEYIELKRNELQNLITVKPIEVDNFHELKKELRQIEEDIIKHDEKIKKLKVKVNNEKESLDKLSNSIKLIQTDIINNKDAKKLRNLGSKEGFNSFKDTCPTCNQSISDTLLVNRNVADVMSIEDNIKHLKSQEKLFEFAIKQKETNIKNTENNIAMLENTVSKLYQLSRVTRNDIFAIDGSVSESTIYKKIELNKTITELEKVKIDIEEGVKEFKQLADDRMHYLKDLNNLPKDKFTSLDKRKIKSLRDNFVSNLKVFGYRSSSDINKVMISKDPYMPTIENF